MLDGDHNKSNEAKVIGDAREALIERYAEPIKLLNAEIDGMPDAVIRQHFREFADDLAALRPVAEPRAGSGVIPREPTEAMIDATLDMPGWSVGKMLWTRKNAREFWRAMYDAAPSTALAATPPAAEARVAELEAALAFEIEATKGLQRGYDDLDVKLRAAEARLATPSPASQPDATMDMSAFDFEAHGRRVDAARRAREASRLARNAVGEVQMRPARGTDEIIRIVEEAILSGIGFALRDSRQ